MQQPEQSLPADVSAAIPAGLEAHLEMVTMALIALPLAAGLGALLAFRPRRRGIPPITSSTTRRIPCRRAAATRSSSRWASWTSARWRPKRRRQRATRPEVHAQASAGFGRRALLRCARKFPIRDLKWT